MTELSEPTGEGGERIEIRNNPERSRYEAHLGGAVAGFAAYRMRGNPADIVVFTHTEVDPAYEGEGVGSALAKAALDDVRLRGLGLVAMCPFISAYIRRHPEYADLAR
jgi:predicted GNAT family acetyltransferase